ncbi:MAG TPA: helix-turn-helix domain-containing protein [Novosphingobium sp.]|nr:helix-turn-helix domain-containing protein [Novosphingobium sp.]
MAEADALQLDRVEVDTPDEAERFARAGERLRAARERAGMNRTELSLRTKINERHLEAVEGSDFSALPARIYAVGFARSYAGAVGLDAAEIAAEVRRELTEHESPGAPRPAHQMDIEDPAKIPSRRLAWIAGALAVALVAAVAVFWRSYFVPAVDLPAVREQVAASSTPELTPAALVSPTAESAALTASPAPLEPAAAPSTAPRGVAPSSRAPTAAPAPTQALPSPIPEKLEPIVEPFSPPAADA